jgi:clan AA aspartic protease (TIGR02281 family)
MNANKDPFDYTHGTLEKGFITVREIRCITALTVLALGFIASGCKSTTERPPAWAAVAQKAHVLSTNAVPVEIEDDHVFVRGTIHGQDVRLVFDTGATHVLVSPEKAATMGMKDGPAIPIFAFGTDKGSAKQAIADSITIGPAVADNVPSVIMPMPAVFGADGMLGLSFLKKFDFRLDYENKSLRFAPAESGSIATNKAVLASENYGNLLTVLAEVDGIPARLIVDTGAGQSLILHPWFVEKKKLRQRYPKRLSVVTGGGLLGLMRGEYVRVQTLKLGDCTLTNVLADFDSKKPTRPGDIAGYIGAGILRRFNLSFDSASQRMFFEPNAGFAVNPPPPACVRSGLVCLPDGTNWIVKDVIPGSPAAEAGVRLEDRLLEIDGHAVQPLKLGEVKSFFQAVPGTPVRLRVQTNGESPREAILTLRDLLAP